MEHGSNTKQKLNGIAKWRFGWNCLAVVFRHYVSCNNETENFRILRKYTVAEPITAFHKQVDRIQLHN
jgi:hypothetical protein